VEIISLFTDESVKAVSTALLMQSKNLSLLGISLASLPLSPLL